MWRGMNPPRNVRTNSFKLDVVQCLIRKRSHQVVNGDTSTCTMIFYLIGVALSLLCAAEALRGVNPGPPGYKYVAAGRNDPPPCKTDPGMTYCEDVEHYPLEQILYALANSKFDVSKFLIDESLDDGPNFNSDKNDSSELLSRRPEFGRSGTWNFNSTLYPPLPPHPYRPHIVDTSSDAYSLYWRVPKAQTPLRYNRVPRKVLEVYPNISEASLKLIAQRRIKRQEEGRKEPQEELLEAVDYGLCGSKTSFIYPKVAKSTVRGEWLYLINIPRVRMTQMIKSQICEPGVEGKPCMDSRCKLPLGYKSVCEQHYLQKRLLTLVPDGGTEVYTDMFWIPTCCVCKTYKPFSKKNR